jgi:2-methylcitrate dehydratase PrpD
VNAPAPLASTSEPAISAAEPLCEVASQSQRLGAVAAAFELSQVPATVIAGAKLCILDAIGIAFASNTFDFAARTAAGISDVAGPGEHVVIGRRERLPLRDAALLNGVLIHGLDYDDTHPGSVVHATASALPVVLAEGFKRGVTGARALAAYVLAVEADARIGLHAGGWWQKAGFHPTGVVGVFGAALAAGYLQEQSREQLALGQGLALSMASGSMEFLDDGTWTKRLHPGWAASSGLTAASLARHGFDSPRQAFEGRFGLFNTYLGGRWPGAERDLFDALGERWETASVAIKPYPVCHFNHACGDAALALQAEHGFRAEDVVAITARIHRNQMPVVCEPAAAKLCPQSDYDAKFSLPYFVAACLVRGRFGLRELEPASITDPDILALCAKVRCEHDAESAFPDFFSGQVEIQLRDGRRLERRERVNRGAAERPLSRQEIEEKYLANALLAVAPAQAEAVLSAVMNLDQASSLEPLCAALSLP